MFENYMVMFEKCYAAKKYYNGMVTCLDRYRTCIKNIIEIQKQIEDEEFVKGLQVIAYSENKTLEDYKEIYMNFIRHYEKIKYRQERYFRERYGVQTPEELEAKIREFEPEMKRLEEDWKLQKRMSRKGKNEAG